MTEINYLEEQERILIDIWNYIALEERRLEGDLSDINEEDFLNL